MKYDTLIIKQKAVNYYKKIIESYKNRDFDYVKTQYLKADTEWYQSEYLSLQIIRQYQTAMEVNKDNVKNFFPLEDYKISYYCNNRVIALEKNEGKYKGKSMFLYENITKEGNKKIIALDLYLHIPKGKTELEIIR